MCPTDGEYQWAVYGGSAMADAESIIPEGEDLEEKSEYTKLHHERKMLVKTIVAMANTVGGRIILRSVTEVPLKTFDSARLDDLVRKYAEPPVRGITSMTDGGEVVIEVPESTRKPHVFTCDFWYEDDKGKRKPAFLPGQVWVRHSSKTSPAAPEDFSRFMREEIARFLERLSLQVGNPEYPLRMTEGADGEGLPVRYSNEEGAIAVTPDIEKQYPYTTKDLGRVLGKGQNWAARAARVLGVREDPEFWWGWKKKGARDFAVQLYSERALEAMRAKLAEDPGWSPYKKQAGKEP